MEYDKERASEAHNADEEAEQFLSIFSSVALEETVLMLESGNEVRCQISHPQANAVANMESLISDSAGCEKSIVTLNYSW